ncbi:Paraneoplastic antigen Ma1 [Merluccius polli]|uniref:Paraneoplastic antigen Ma1 n=1 Tax=Merluccius polli TaxID=89951 RepID=A0AA47MCY1_MERPO|nr:Paraneoplastic antigen Ma1 [Merluccius polli]
MDFGDILCKELARISESISSETPVETSETPVEIEPPLTQSDIQATAPSFVSVPTEVSQTFYRPQTGTEVRDLLSPVRERTSPFHLPSDQLSTPEVQRVVVEHIVKSSEISSHLHSPCKLKQFSGRLPQPTFEVDYDTWRNSVEFCLNDPSVPNSQVVRKIVESLSPPAANIIKSLGPQASPKEYLTLLDSAYATVEDGDELFARFLNNNQNAGEKAPDYLQRLHTALNYVVAKGGISAPDADKQLLKQFCRGCWNSLLITSLQLEQLKSKPPSFAELLLLLRKEEDKQANKASRMKEHLGFTKPKAMSNVQAAHILHRGY